MIYLLYFYLSDRKETEISSSLKVILRFVIGHCNTCVCFPDESVHPLMQKVNIPTVTQDQYPKHFFINFSTGQFAFSRPLAFRPQPGGVLADEMGLGKALEVLELILKHPRSEFDQYSFPNFDIKGTQLNHNWLSVEKLFFGDLDFL